ncbi:MAG: VirB3 family type IV secretion system protein [Bacteroidota bacterium]
MAATTDVPIEEPTRVRVHTSLTERPLFGGVDMEVFLVSGFLIWTAFLVFGFSLPLLLVVGVCVVLITLMRRANAKDPFFLPILFRSLFYRRIYAPRKGATEVGPARPSLPTRPFPS